MVSDAGGCQTHRAVLLVALDGEIWTEEQVSNGQQQGLSQRLTFVISIVVQVLEGEELRL